MSVGGDAELDIPEKVGALKSAFAHVFLGRPGEHPGPLVPTIEAGRSVG